MADDRLNVLLITSDQQHHDTLGVSNPRIHTPALDRLAREGTRFERAYCNNPVCTPSRSTIITGMYPSWHGAWTIGVKLAEDVPTVGDRFQQHGYATTLVGKAHFQPLASAPGQESLEMQPTLRDLDFWRGFNGPWYGFEHIELARNHADEAHAGQHYALWMEERGLHNWRDYFQTYSHSHAPDPDAPRRKHSWDLPQEYHYTTWTAERTIANIGKHVAEERPFFLWSSFHDPHPPYLVPEPWASMYDPDEMRPGARAPGELELMPPHYLPTQERNPNFSAYQETPYSNHGLQSHLVDEAELKHNMAVYYGAISFMDAQIGRILDSLDSLGVADDTLVVFSTDHGHFLGQHGLVAKGPFHYEDLLRVPLLVRCPGRVPPGAVGRSLQALVDLPSTFLDAAGLEIPGIMQGVSQWEVWQGRADSARRDVIVENRHQPTAVHLRTYINERYKLTVYRNHEYGELFDLEADPEELHNRWDDPAYGETKCALMQSFINAELEREPTRFPRIAGA